jgi:transposase
MNVMKRAPVIELTDSERKTLASWSRGRSTPSRLVLRARVILAASTGAMNQTIAAEVGTSKKTVSLWRSRFVQQRLAGIQKDAPRPGRTPSIPAKTLKAILHKTTQEKPADATHWSTRSMAQAVGVSKATVQRVWAAHGLKPHLVKGFKVSNDPQFAEKLIDVVGLYLNPPEHALVLCVDEKSSIQALDRTQKSLPIYPGRAGTMTHDYKRHGTTTLFAALEMAEGLLYGMCMKRHRHQEWIRFLKRLDEQTPADYDLHLILDNYATHKHPKVKTWIARHPRFKLHFIPTSSSWLNLVERWFRDLTQKQLRRGTFHSVSQLRAAIETYIDQHNEEPQPFVWTAKAEEIIAKVSRARAALDKSPSV